MAELVHAAQADGDELTGPEGLQNRITKMVLETARREEMNEHLGHGQAPGAARPAGCCAGLRRCGAGPDAEAEPRDVRNGTRVRRRSPTRSARSPSRCPGTARTRSSRRWCLSTSAGWTSTSAPSVSGSDVTSKISRRVCPMLQLVSQCQRPARTPVLVCPGADLRCAQIPHVARYLPGATCFLGRARCPWCRGPAGQCTPRWVAEG